MIDEKRLIKECEERLLVGTNVIKLKSSLKFVNGYR